MTVVCINPGCVHNSDGLCMATEVDLCATYDNNDLICHTFEECEEEL